MALLLTVDERCFFSYFFTSPLALIGPSNHVFLVVGNRHVMSMTSQLPLRKLPGCGYSTCTKIKAELGCVPQDVVSAVLRLASCPWGHFFVTPKANSLSNNREPSFEKCLPLRTWSRVTICNAHIRQRFRAKSPAGMARLFFSWRMHVCIYLLL